MTNTKKGILLVLCTAFISGFSIFMNGIFVSTVPPSTFAFLKNGLTATLLAFIILTGISVTKVFKAKSANNNAVETHPTKKDWLKLAIIGLVGGSVPFILFFEGLAQTGGPASSLIHKTMFIFVMLFSVIFLKEKLNNWVFPAAIALLIANYLLLDVNITTFTTGHALVLAATILWAIENVISKHLLQNLSGNLVAFGRMFFGAIFIAAYLTITGQIGQIITLNTNQWMITLIATAFLLAYVVTWYNGLKHVPVSLATAILLIGSSITTLLNYVLLSKDITFEQFTGIALTVLAVLAWISLIRSNKPNKLPAEVKA